MLGGSLIVTAGDGCRSVASVTRDVQNSSSPVCSSFSSQGEPDRDSATSSVSPVTVRKQVLLIGDSMARCFPFSDATFHPVIRDDYQFDSIAQQVVDSTIDIHYKFIIVWTGAHAIHQVKLNEVPAQLKSLVNVIHNRNPTVKLFISSLLPKPRENHLVEHLIVAYNRGIKAAIQYIRQQGFDITYLPSHQLFLDDDKQILRPIIDSFEDGFHLNIHGAHKICRFWLQQLGLVK